MYHNGTRKQDKVYNEPRDILFNENREIKDLNKK